MPTPDATPRQIAVERTTSPGDPRGSPSELRDGGELGALIRSFDWSRTAVGPIETWPQSLRTALSICLASKFPMCLWWGRDFVTFYNDAFRVILGDQHPGALGSSGAEIWAERGAIAESVWRTGEAMSRDLMLVVERHGAREASYFTCSYSPVGVESGTVGGILIVCQETTARVMSERRMQEFVEQAPVGIVLLSGPSHRVVVANEVFRALAHGKELVGMLPTEALPELANSALPAILDHVFHTGEPFIAHEYRVMVAEPSGELRERFFRFQIAPLFDATSAITDLAVVATEVTDQVVARRQVQAAQDRLNFALDAAKVGHWELDLVTDRVTRSLRHDQIFGYTTPVLDWTLETFLGHVAPDHRERVHTNLRRAIAECGAISDECPITAADGTPRWIGVDGRCASLDGRCERAPDGTPSRVLGIVRDITERKQAEEQRQLLLSRESDARAEAEAANRAKDDFLAMLGHELRNPLAPILTALQLLKLRHDPTLETVLMVIDRQLNHVVHLVDDLLDVSRIASGKLELAKERIEIAEVVTKAVEMACPVIELREHRLAIEVPRAGLAVDADPTRLSQVIANLLTNAAKYTEKGGAITIIGERAKDRVRLRVQDTGIGIAPEMTTKIFEMFVQERQASDRSQGGLGLGLNLVRSLVALHGGNVVVHSQGPGRGAEFEIDLPAAAPEAFAAAPASASGQVAADGSIAKPQMILVVDDNEDAAMLLADLLQLYGYETRIAHSAKEALGVVEQVRPDVALLDIGLPEIDGNQLARLLHQQPALKHMHLVAITGYGQAQDREQTSAAGFDAHLVKPVDTARLRRVLESFAPSAQAPT